MISDIEKESSIPQCSSPEFKANNLNEPAQDNVPLSPPSFNNEDPRGPLVEDPREA